VTVASGASRTFTITANSGYQIAAVTVNGSSVGAVGTYTFTNVTANATIAATFSAVTPTQHTITASAGAGGSISPSGAVVVARGSSRTFTITANSGYQIAGVTVNGSSVGAVGTYTFTNVTANATIAATFSAVTPTQHTITATAGAGGAISPSGAVVVARGSSRTFTITANSGYRIAGVTVNGSSVGAVGTYTFTNVTANATIAATFAATGADTTPPTAPANLAAVVTGRQVRLTWTASTDAVGVMDYQVYRDGVVVGSSSKSNCYLINPNVRLVRTPTSCGPATTPETYPRRRIPSPSPLTEVTAKPVSALRNGVR